MKDEVLKVRKVDDSEESPDYVGIKLNNGTIEIAVPSFLHLDNFEKHGKLNREERDLLLMFLRSINISKSIKEEKFKKSKESGNSWPFESYLWIINDYLENGYYFNRDKKYYSDNKGKIEWKKTLKNMPIVSNDNVIYDKLVTSRTSSLDSVITGIYKICLKYSIDKMAWYRDLNIKVDVVQTKPISEMIYIVRKELNNTFDDVKRLRFNHMLKILSLATDQDLYSNDFTYWINNYHYVYEKMVDFLFKGISEKEKGIFNPKGSWDILGVAEPKSASNLRPDTIFIKKDDDVNKVFILDAKMYKFGYTSDLKDLPETTSIQKQITYGDHVLSDDAIKEKYGDVEVRNAFIIPYNAYIFKEKTDKNGLGYNLEDVTTYIKYIGEAHADWRKNKQEEKPHERIFTFLIDFNYLLKNYKKADTSDIDKLCDKIDEYLKKKN